NPGNLLVTATFQGTQNGNLVTDITDVALAINGISVTGTYTLASLNGPLTGAAFTGSASNAVISIDGTQNDFAFINSAESSFINEYFESDGDFIHVTDSTYPGFGTAFGTDSPLNSTWVLTDPPSAPVPDSGATVSLLGLSMLGLVCFRRKFGAK
ncbi:MAG: VPDSG-CTERM sorting domain-containing protein, partial [Opitutaceae bacterium]